MRRRRRTLLLMAATTAMGSADVTAVIPEEEPGVEEGLQDKAAAADEGLMPAEPAGGKKGPEFKLLKPLVVVRMTGEWSGRQVRGVGDRSAVWVTGR